MEDCNRTSPSRVFVGTFIGVLIIYYSFLVFGWVGGTICLILGGYEAWTLTNKYKNDTITETIQAFASQTAMVPLIFGVALCDMYHRGWLDEPWQLGVVCFLMGHFFMGKKLRNWRQGRF